MSPQGWFTGTRHNPQTWKPFAGIDRRCSAFGMDASCWNGVAHLMRASIESVEETVYHAPAHLRIREGPRDLAECAQPNAYDPLI
jgi:hypothetical protein